MAGRGYLRSRYGDVFVTRLPSGEDIPWKLLSIGDYLEYQLAFQAGLVDEYFLAEEVYKKAVVDNKLREDPNLPAGTVPAVVAGIMGSSGPASTEQFNAELDLARKIIGMHPIHAGAIMICQAFPGYKPDEVYKLSYPDFMLRLAQAEFVLMKAGVLKEPVKAVMPGEEASNSLTEGPRSPKKASRALLEAWEAQERAGGRINSLPKNPDGPTPARPGTKSSKTPHAPSVAKKSPVLEAFDRREYALADRKKVRQETAELNQNITHWDRTELPTRRAKMIEDARVIYKDLIADLEKRKGSSKTSK